MTQLNTLMIEKLETALRTQRVSMREVIRAHLNRSDDPMHLALTEQLERAEDWTAADLLNETAASQLKHEISELSEIDAALQRIRLGTYGTCTHCGELISAERMQAVPQARHCLKCQSEFEKHQHLTQ